MNRDAWLFPMFAIVGGPFLPVAILIYWLANNAGRWGSGTSCTARSTRGSADPSAPVVDSVATSGQDSDIEHQPGEVPGVIEDHNRGADKPGDSR